MKWFKRTLWLAAWGVWVWLGVGLYRELPRKSGPQLSNVNFHGLKMPMGFVGEQDVIAVQTSSRNNVRNLTLCNARNGHVIGFRHRPMNHVISDRGDQRAADLLGPSALDASLRHGFLLGVGNGEIERKAGPTWTSTGGLYALDVMKDELRQLTERTVSIAAVHPEKPWVAFVDGEEGKRGNRVAVVDYTTGRTVFTTPRDSRMSMVGTPLFVVDGDLLLVKFAKPFEEMEDVDRSIIQIWTIADPPVLFAERIMEDWRPYSASSVARNGRVLFAGRSSRETPNATYVEVYDVKDNEFLPLDPHAKRPLKGRRQFSVLLREARLAISPSGRTVLKYGSVFTKATGPNTKNTLTPTGGLHEIGSGRTIWTLSPHTRIASVTRDQFLVHENWHDMWKDWFPNAKYETHAWRTLDAGDVEYRLPHSPVGVPRDFNAAGTLVMMLDGSVHTWPPRVNWALLALCQAVLALPLVLLWAISCWRTARRKRAIASISSVQP